MMKEMSNALTDNNEVIQSDDKINLDKSKMSQVIRNFMSNAIKFTPENGTIKVSV